MPLVFVHGVGNRVQKKYQEGVHTRDALFQKYLLQLHKSPDGKPVEVVNPHWGDLGGKLRWGGDSVPIHRDATSLASAQAAELVEFYLPRLASASPGRPVQADLEDTVVLEAARQSLPAAVNLLWTAAAVEVGDAGAASELAELSEPTYEYAVKNKQPDWLTESHHDDDFVSRLEQEVERGKSAHQAAWWRIDRGVRRIRETVRNVAGGVGATAVDLARTAATERAASFLGDVFVYLQGQTRTSPGEIGIYVSNAILDAAASCTDKDPLVVVAHSMGGNIVYDLLADELRDVDIKLFITVGTQVGFFEELKLFRQSDKTVVKPTLVDKPSNVEHWINVLDYSDPLAFYIDRIIDDVKDYSYRTGSIIKAHSKYFLQPGFHAQLVARTAGLYDLAPHAKEWMLAEWPQ